MKYIIIEYYKEDSGRYTNNPQLRWHIIQSFDNYNECYEKFVKMYKDFKSCKNENVVFIPSDFKKSKELIEYITNKDKSVILIKKIK